MLINKNYLTQAFFGENHGDAKETVKTVEEYIAALPENARKYLEQLRRIVRETAPNSEEMISYGMPAFRLKGRGLVYFAAWKNHAGFYPGAATIEAFEKDLSPFKKAKGSVQFPYDKPVPSDLVKKIV